MCLNTNEFFYFFFVYDGRASSSVCEVDDERPLILLKMHFNHMILFVVIFCEVYLGLVVARRVVYKCVCVYWRMYKFNCIWGGNVVLPRGWGGADDVRVLHQDGRDGKELLCLHAVLSACALQIVVAYKHASFPRDFAIAQLDFPR